MWKQFPKLKAIAVIFTKISYLFVNLPKWNVNYIYLYLLKRINCWETAYHPDQGCSSGLHSYHQRNFPLKQKGTNTKNHSQAICRVKDTRTSPHPPNPSSPGSKNLWKKRWEEVKSQGGGEHKKSRPSKHTWTTHTHIYELTETVASGTGMGPYQIESESGE